MFDKIKKVYELKRKADALKKELESEVMDIETGDIKIRINGAQKILNLEFPKDVDPNKLKDAINKAMNEAQKAAANRMQGMMGGLENLQDLLGS